MLALLSVDYVLYFFLPFAAALSKFSFTLNFTILLIKSKGIGLSKGGTTSKACRPSGATGVGRHRCLSNAPLLHQTKAVLLIALPMLACCLILLVDSRRCTFSVEFKQDIAISRGIAGQSHCQGAQLRVVYEVSPPSNKVGSHLPSHSRGEHRRWLPDHSHRGSWTFHPSTWVMASNCQSASGSLLEVIIERHGIPWLVPR